MKKETRKRAARRQRAKHQNSLQKLPLELQRQILEYCLPFDECVDIPSELNIGVLGVSRFYRTEGSIILTERNIFRVFNIKDGPIINLDYGHGLLPTITKIRLMYDPIRCHCEALRAGLNILDAAAMMPSLRSMDTGFSPRIWWWTRECWTEASWHSDYRKALYEIYQRFQIYRRERKDQNDVVRKVCEISMFNFHTLSDPVVDLLRRLLSMLLKDVGAFVHDFDRETVENNGGNVT